MRLWLATALTWLGARIAPPVMRPIFDAYCEMLSTFPKELKEGRTFGVVVVPWGTRAPAQAMAEQALAAARSVRASIEGMNPRVRGDQ